eukprot:TRINITY_DN8747_c0_g1_i1.p1 TRINITY_DN8747_c0_g1~~TRINITY_DN8747_c0_g1_i1.p1  ORF type:complete len:136 (+),score=12.77 TRINITY_DN8747_c0_g1_i1:91-498(+)
MATAMKGGAMVATSLDEGIIKDKNWELKWFHAARGDRMPGERKKAPWHPLPPALPPTPAPSSRPGTTRPHTNATRPPPTGASRPQTSSSEKSPVGQSRSCGSLGAAGTMLATEARANRRSMPPRGPGCGRSLSVL